jgi:2-oxoglutarate ferredoxin oxidoreductase subunit alpha
MAEKLEVKELDQVVVRFSGDSGDGMQLAGNIFSTVSATVGNGISTFPDYPADIRAPQGSLTGVSGFQVHIGAGKVYTPGDLCDVLVAMNAAALKTQYRYAKPGATIIIDTDSFGPKDLEKAQFKTSDYLGEMDIDPDRVIACPMTQMVKAALTAPSSSPEGNTNVGKSAPSGAVGGTLDNKTILKTRNMFALGLVCWLFDRDLDLVANFLKEKFAKKPAIAEANIKVIQAGYDFGHNTHSSASNVYRIESKVKEPGRYMDITGNKATAYGLIAAAEKAGLPLYLGSYPITPATDILHELSKHKSCGVITVQCEDEISGCASAVGAAFAGALAVTSTSGPGVCLKSEAMNLAVIDELPLLIIDVQRGGPSTGLPTKSEQTDLLQALYGRNGESPMPVIAALSPTDCFDAAFDAAKIALEHLTPVVLLTDAFVANGSGAFLLPESMDELEDINPPYVTPELKGHYTPYFRDPETLVRYWAIPGQEGYTHILGGLEKDGRTGAISTDPENHDEMCRLRAEKVARIPVPDLVVEGDRDRADLLIVGFGSTYGHLYSAMQELRKKGHRVALAQFRYINPLPKNTARVLRKYPNVVVAEQNLGQLAAYLRSKVDEFVPYQFNQVKGQPFVVSELVEAFENILEPRRTRISSVSLSMGD